VQQVLRKAGRGFAVGPHHIPIVPSAILFDLINGGEKDWGEGSPYRALGVEAANSATLEFQTGSTGAGFGALTGGPAPGLKGGLGTASTELTDGVIVAALVAVNALGSPVRGDRGQFRAADFEIEGEFGNFRAEATNPSDVHIKFSEGERTPGANTTIGIIATNAKLSKGAAKRLAVAAHDGFAHALWPAHTPLDGDLVFSLATGEVEIGGDLPLSIELSAAAGATMARAIARGVYDATAHPNDLFPTWQDRFRPS
ncbi:MAG: P1 family peptidase, partial [Pseudomonadota bacterium]